MEYRNRYESIQWTLVLSEEYFSLVCSQKFKFQPCFMLTICLAKYNILWHFFDLRSHRINKQEILNKVIWLWFQFWARLRIFNLFSSLKLCLVYAYMLDNFNLYTLIKVMLIKRGWTVDIDNQTWLHWLN